jgi:HEPN domain-containing protein
MSGSADLPELLLGLARDDEFAARSLLPVEGVADAILGFHAQQAVEKALKAALASRAIEFPYTHDLDGLLELCRTNGLDVPPGLDGVDRLAPYGVHIRYGTSRGGALDRDQALAWAASAIEWARGVI